MTTQQAPCVALPVTETFALPNYAKITTGVESHSASHARAHAQQQECVLLLIVIVTSRFRSERKHNGSIVAAGELQNRTDTSE